MPVSLEQVFAHDVQDYLMGRFRRPMKPTLPRDKNNEVQCIKIHISNLFIFRLSISEKIVKCPRTFQRGKLRREYGGVIW